jgi:hypothetical protein
MKLSYQYLQFFNKYMGLPPDTEGQKGTIAKLLSTAKPKLTHFISEIDRATKDAMTIYEWLQNFLTKETREEVFLG